MGCPRISIIIPTYNRAALLPAAIRSVQAQTLPDWELIIVDDGSTDGTAETIEPLLRNDSRLTWLTNHTKRGPAGARNTGIRAARGTILAFLDSDDSWEPSKLACFLERFDEAPTTVLVASDYRIVDRESPVETTMKSCLLNTMIPWWRTDPLASAVTHSEAISKDIQSIAKPGLFVGLTIAGFPWIHTSSAMLRREPALAAGLFDERLQRTEDIDLWLKLDGIGPFIYIDEVLASYDITGRDGATGVRYSSYDPSRRHTGYVEATYHLRLLDRIEQHYLQTADQASLLKRRRTSHHRHCAVAALRERYWPGLLHAISCLKNAPEREALLREMREILTT